MPKHRFFHVRLAQAALLAAVLAPASMVHAQSALPSKSGATLNPLASSAEKTKSASSSATANWISGIKLGLQAEAGIVANTLSPDNNRNFGRLLLDNANRPTLNQLLFTMASQVDKKSASPTIGFNLQLLYGSDARIYATMGVFDQLIHDRNQLTPTEANVAIRLPGLFKNGMDIKAGIFTTPLGVEVINPKQNPFYSHSYIGLYGLPFKHTGVLTTSHVSDVLDIYLGVDTGSQAWVAYGAGDNNNRPGGIAGIGLSLLDGRFTVLALTHIGPEDSKRNVRFANSANRYYNDLAITYQATKQIAFSLEANYVREDGFNAEAYGLAGYASYALNDSVSLNGRAEVFRDNDNFFVSTPVGNRDYVNSERGSGSRLITASKPTTYSEFTAGLTYKPSWTPEALSTAMVRPEIRYDRALNGTKPYGEGNESNVFTLAADIILGF